MEALYPTAAKESVNAHVPDTCTSISSNEAAQPAEATAEGLGDEAEATEAEATQAVGLLKALDDVHQLGLVVIDELHQ